MTTKYLPRKDKETMLYLLSKLRDQYDMYNSGDKEIIELIHQLSEEIYFNVLDEEDK